MKLEFVLGGIHVTTGIVNAGGAFGFRKSYGVGRLPRRPNSMDIYGMGEKSCSFSLSIIIRNLVWKLANYLQPGDHPFFQKELSSEGKEINARIREGMRDSYFRRNCIFQIWKHEEIFLLLDKKSRDDVIAIESSKSWNDTVEWRASAKLHSIPLGWTAFARNVHKAHPLSE